MMSKESVGQLLKKSFWRPMEDPAFEREIMQVSSEWMKLKYLIN